MAPEERPQRLLEVSRHAVSAAAQQPVQTLLTLFQEDPDLLAVSICQGESFLGCVSRKAMYDLASRPFAVDLYAKRPIITLLEDLRFKRVIMDPGTEINQAAMDLLSLDPTLQTDAFPLVEKGNCVGIVSVADLMMAVAADQRRLRHALDRLSSRIREEVARAAKIQQDLLPLPCCRFSDIIVGAGVTTSTEIGGDFYDYFPIGAGKLGLVVADVSGHGVQAGMVTTAAKASLHTLVSLGVTTPAGLLSGMNNAILATARQTLLMTCLIACIDPAARTITFANAGHNFPFLCRAGAAEAALLDAATGFPLGFEKDCTFQEARTDFAPGDTFFLYTDGIIECCDELGEEFGYQRVAQILAENRDLPPHLLHDTLLTEAAAFTGQPVFDDDVTTLVAAFAARDTKE